MYHSISFLLLLSLFYFNSFVSNPSTKSKRSLSCILFCMFSFFCVSKSSLFVTHRVFSAKRLKPFYVSVTMWIDYFMLLSEQSGKSGFFHSFSLTFRKTKSYFYLSLCSKMRISFVISSFFVSRLFCPSQNKQNKCELCVFVIFLWAFS